LAGGFVIASGWRGCAYHTLPGSTRRIRALMLPFSKAPLGPRAISTICSW
jgi:hypothetical protein